MTKTVLRAAVAMALLSALVAGAQVLPKPEEAFKDAQIGRTYKDSKPGTMAITKAPSGAPNVLIILIDDAGFGQWGTFGGQVPTPNLDRLAKLGLRYTRFHTTALCSPTRAALLTGRNHHSAGTGVITEIGDAYPGYSGQIPKSTAMFAEVLRQSATAPHSSARTTTSPTGRRAFPGHSTGGPACRGSITSTVSSAARWTNGSRFSIAAPRRSRWISPRARKATTR
jgi:hypothetical protein